ncbi:MAG: RNA polymerase sigma factor [Bacteroidia bacterium]
MSPEEETQYIENSKTNPKYFEPLYTKYYERILKFVYKRMEGLEDAREVTAIVFAKALTNVSKYKHMGFPFSSWLYRIAINEVNLFYRHSKKARVISIDNKGLKNMAEETEAVNEEVLAELKRALMYLNEDELLLIELRFFEDHSFAEVAQILEITENNAKVKTYRVLDKLRSVYKKIA